MLLVLYGMGVICLAFILSNTNQRSIYIMLNVKEINGNIETIREMGAKLDPLIHLTAVNCLAHAQAHGDVTLITRLVDAMPKSGRKKALMFWFANFGPLHFDKDAVCGLVKGKKVKAYDVEGADATPFWEFTPEKNPAPITVEGLVKFIQRKVELAKERGDLTDADLPKLDEKIHGILQA